MTATAVSASWWLLERPAQRLRHRLDVKPFWRLINGGDVFEIVPPTAEIGRRQFLDLTCRAINQATGDSRDVLALIVAGVVGLICVILAAPKTKRAGWAMAAGYGFLAVMPAERTIASWANVHSSGGSRESVMLALLWSGMWSIITITAAIVEAPTPIRLPRPKWKV